MDLTTIRVIGVHTDIRQVCTIEWETIATKSFEIFTGKKVQGILHTDRLSTHQDVKNNFNAR